MRHGSGMGLGSGQRLGEVVASGDRYVFPLGGDLGMYAGNSVYAPTFARTTAETYVDPSTGLLTTAAIDQPCFEVMPGGGVGLRMDPTRSNLFLQSSALDNAAWTKTRLEVPAALVPGLSGALTAYPLIPTVDNATHHVYQVVTGLSAAVDYAITIPFKPGNITYLWVNYVFKTSAHATISTFSSRYTTTTGVNTPIAGTFLTCSVLPATVNGFYRPMVVMTAPATTAECQVLVYAFNGTGTTFAGDGVTVNITLDSPQFEAGGFPSAYIPTGASAAQATRDTLTYPNLVAPTNHAVLIDVVPMVGLPVGAPTAFNLVTFNGTGGVDATGRTEAGADYDFAPAASGGYLATYKAADLSTTGRNRIVQWVRQDGENALASLYLNGTNKKDVTAAGTLGGMDLTTQFGGYGVLALCGWLSNVIILNNPTAADVAALATM